ncbi:MAG: exosortase [Pseudomonadota bacterium]
MDMTRMHFGQSFQSLQAVVVVTLLVVCTASVFFNDTWQVLQRWLNDDNYSHGLLLMPITLYLIFAAIRPLAVRPRPDRLALAGVVTAAVVMLIGALASVAVSFQLLLPWLLLSVLLAIYGRRALPAVCFPVVFTYFSLPVWDALSPLLQTLTTVAVERMIYATGVSALINGNFVTVSAGVFEIAEGCSGLRFFMISAAVAALYSYWYLHGWRRQLSFVAFAVALAMVGNWVRVYIVIRMGIWLGIDHPYVAEHGPVGWVIFALTMAILFGLSGRWETAMAVRAATAASDRRDSSPSFTTLAAPFVLIGTLFVVLLGVQHYASQGVRLRVAPPEGFYATAQRGPVCGDWGTQVAGAQQTVRGVVPGSPAACVDFAFFDKQTAGRELVNVKHRLFGANARRNTRARIAAGERGIHAALLANVGGQPLLVAYQLRVADRVARNSNAAKRQQIMSLLAQRTDAMLVAIGMRCDQRCIAQLESGQLPATVSAMPVFAPEVSLTASDAVSVGVK